MKKVNLVLILFAGLFTCISTVRAQNVPINTNFAQALMSDGFISCISIVHTATTQYYLDTTSSQVLTADTMNISTSQVQDITGIQYFRNLHYLDLSSNPLFLLPSLPSGLVYLDISGSSRFSSIAPLPSTLQYLYCINSILDSLPALPAALKVMNCSNNNLTSISSLPSGMTYLDCSYNQLHGLPVLPSGINYLNCRYNSLSGMPTLNTLPSLPASLTFLDCTFDGLTALPSLPSDLATLMCGSNHLVTLGTLPASLRKLVCSDIAAQSLPALPVGITDLDCSGNYGLYCLPAIGNTNLNSFYISGTGISCLPNAFTATNYDTNPANLPLCGNNCNPTGVYVLIPDSNFGNWLNNNGYSSCLTGDGTHGWRLDTTSSYVTGATHMFCNSAGIRDLTGIQYFRNLSCLYCTGNQLIHLPSLPTHLDTLVCFDNLLVDLPSLPAGLFRLDCGSNAITHLPSLPAGLNWLNCSYNPLAGLPALPVGLYGINCTYDSLASLPALPNGMQELFCSNNHLTSLPALPSSINSLECDNNPSLFCLPFIHTAQLLDFYIHNTGITCLPNRFTISTFGYSDVNPDTFPVCTFPSGCTFSSTISGYLYNDSAGICPMNSQHYGKSIHNVNVRLLKNGQPIQQCYTDSAGEYAFIVDSLQGYTVAVDTSWLPLGVVCPISDSIYVSLSPADTAAANVNFGMQCAASDYGVGLIWGSPFKPGDTTTLYVIAGNPLLYWYNADCGAAMSGTVTTVLSGPVHYAGPAPGALVPSSVSGNTISYTINDLDALVFGSLDIQVYTDTTAVIGSPVCISSSIVSSSPDAYLWDDTLSQCFAVVSAFDPNHKTAYPVSISDAGDWLTYTVEFQNTGTATASTVIIRDTLSPLTQPETFRYIASDHNAFVQVMGSAVTFTFPHINLVDSGTSQPKSKGWLQYKVKSKPNLPVQSQIKNTAYIYFDYNPAVATNTAISTVTATNSGIAELQDNVLRIAPNPNKGSFMLRTSGSINRLYTVSDMLGHIVAQDAIISDQQTINLAGIADGVYSISVKGAQPLRFAVMK